MRQRWKQNVETFAEIHADVGIIDKVLSIIPIDKELLVGCYRTLQRLRIYFNERCKGVCIVSGNFSSYISCIHQRVEGRVDHFHEVQIVIDVVIIIR